MQKKIRYNKACVTGGRDFEDEPFVHKVLTAAWRKFRFKELVHGSASGVDTFADNWCKKNGVKAIPYPADWDEHDLAAGRIRNAEMWNQERFELLIAFPGNRGTSHMTNLCRTVGIRRLIVRYKRPKKRKIEDDKSVGRRTH